MRGDQPVFVVTGRKEDVAMAKREILSAAEHFSLIRASRNKTGPLSVVAGPGLPGAPTLPGQTTIQVCKEICPAFMSRTDIISTYNMHLYLCHLFLRQQCFQKMHCSAKNRTQIITLYVRLDYILYLYCY